MSLRGSRRGRGVRVRREDRIALPGNKSSGPKFEKSWIGSDEPSKGDRIDLSQDQEGRRDMREEIKRLRMENEERDYRLRQLEQAVMALQNRKKS